MKEQETSDQNQLSDKVQVKVVVEERSENEKIKALLTDSKNKYSRKVSVAIRQYSLALVGILWALSSNKLASILQNENWKYALLFVVITICIDFGQYLISTIYFHWFYHKQEKIGFKQKPDKWQLYITWPLFYAKSATLVIAYGFLIKGLI